MAITHIDLIDLLLDDPETSSDEERPADRRLRRRSWNSRATATAYLYAWAKRTALLPRIFAEEEVYALSCGKALSCRNYVFPTACTISCPRLPEKPMIPTVLRAALRPAT